MSNEDVISDNNGKQFVTPSEILNIIYNDGLPSGMSPFSSMSKRIADYVNKKVEEEMFVSK